MGWTGRLFREELLRYIMQFICFLGVSAATCSLSSCDVAACIVKMLFGNVNQLQLATVNWSIIASGRNPHLSQQS